MNNQQNALKLGCNNQDHKKLLVGINIIIIIFWSRKVFYHFRNFNSVYYVKGSQEFVKSKFENILNGYGA